MDILPVRSWTSTVLRQELGYDGSEVRAMQAIADVWKHRDGGARR
jgi:hypothetical protein